MRAGAPRRAEGAAGKALREAVLRTYGDTCWICQHGGARQVDHVESVADRPDLEFTLSNCRPAHGAPGNRCPVCLQYCNQLRGGLSVERARRLIAERAPQSAKPRQRYPQDSGREWLP